MTDKMIYTLRAEPHPVRKAVHSAINLAPDEWVVMIAPPTRKLVQNALMWVLLADIAAQVEWYGLKLSAGDWKDVLSASLRKEIRTVPNVEGNGLVVLGMRTSQMSVREMAEMIEYAYWFGASKGVKFSEPKEGLK